MVEKSQTNAASVTMHRLMQVNWGDIWKYTMGKSKTNSTNVKCEMWNGSTTSNCDGLGRFCREQVK